VADFNIRMTVWSLVNKSCTYIKAPKFAAKGVSFSPDGKFMALAERRDCKDYVSVFSTSAWTVAAHFQVCWQDIPLILYLRELASYSLLVLVHISSIHVSHLSTSTYTITARLVHMLKLHV